MDQTIIRLLGIRIADYFECLVVPSNMKTYKKLIQGFDYIDIGAIHIREESGIVILRN